MRREPTNVFPLTAATWLGAQVRQAGAASRERARTHVMSVYFDPLIIYVKGSSFRALGDPEELVAGFFSDRLQRDDYLQKWLEAGVPLRAWLIRGLKYYCMERIRAGKRDAAAPLPDDHHDDASGPGSDFRREVARALVREAMAQTAAELEARGMGEHWQIFRLHHLDNVPYASIAQSTGLTEDRAAVMGRTAARRLRTRLRDTCAWPGATTEQIDKEILALFD